MTKMTDYKLILEEISSLEKRRQELDEALKYRVIDIARLILETISPHLPEYIAEYNVEHLSYSLVRMRKCLTEPKDEIKNFFEQIDRCYTDDDLKGKYNFLLDLKFMELRIPQSFIIAKDEDIVKQVKADVEEIRKFKGPSHKELRESGYKKLTAAERKALGI